jgi:hypothetical protein
MSKDLEITKKAVIIRCFPVIIFDQNQIPDKEGQAMWYGNMARLAAQYFAPCRFAWNVQTIDTISPFFSIYLCLEKKRFINRAIDVPNIERQFHTKVIIEHTDHSPANLRRVFNFPPIESQFDDEPGYKTPAWCFQLMETFKFAIIKNKPLTSTALIKVCPQTLRYSQKYFVAFELRKKLGWKNTHFEEIITADVYVPRGFEYGNEHEIELEVKCSSNHWRKAMEKKNRILKIGIDFLSPGFYDEAIKQVEAERQGGQLPPPEEPELKTQSSEQAEIQSLRQEAEKQFSQFEEENLVPDDLEEDNSDDL